MKRALIALSLVMLFAGEVYSHGVGYRESKLQAIPLEFSYSTGEAMSYCEARVFSPNDSKFAAQTGRTDEQGRFAFIPDTSGDWRVVVQDNEGHRCEAVVNINLDDVKANAVVEASETNQSHVIPALLGVSIIFNIALLVVNRRKQHAH